MILEDLELDGIIEKIYNMDDKKLRYKDIHGTTRVGDFLRKLNKSNILDKGLEALSNLATGDALGALKTIIGKNDELTPEQRIHAIKLIELDIQDMQGVTDRWKFDMSSDNKLSKSIRPLTLIFLTTFLIIFIFLDSFYIDYFTINSEWIELLKTLLTGVYIAYFGGRSYEKSKKL